MQIDALKIHKELEGWTLFWASLAATSGGGDELGVLRGRVAEAARARLDIQTLSSEPVVAAVRRLFKQAGTDPTRYRPSSEALLRRLLKGGELSAISPIVDVNNCLSAELAVPCCVMAEGTFEPEMVWRAGREGESYVSLKGPFKLEGKPLLCDGRGPLDTPITGNERVKVMPETKLAWLVAYLPAGEVHSGEAHEALDGLVQRAPVVDVLGTASF